MIIESLVKMTPKKVFSQQAKKPTGLFGRLLMTKVFNRGNADLNDFTKEMLNLEKTDRILEIGFGPGQLVAEMASIATDGIVEGVDFSEPMLKQASKTNQQAIASNRVKLHLGECRELPFPDNSFDKLCSVNTLYFWDKPERYLLEMLRVLKPQGRIAIAFRDDEQMNRLDLCDDVFCIYSQTEVVNLLREAGFNDAYVVGKNGEPFTSYCAIATKK